MPKTCDDCVNAYICSLAKRDMTVTDCKYHIPLDEYLANTAKAIRALKSVRDLAVVVTHTPSQEEKEVRE